MEWNNGLQQDHLNMEKNFAILCKVTFVPSLNTYKNRSHMIYHKKYLNSKEHIIYDVICLE